MIDLEEYKCFFRRARQWQTERQAVEWSLEAEQRGLTLISEVERLREEIKTERHMNYIGDRENKRLQELVEKQGELITVLKRASGGWIAEDMMKRNELELYIEKLKG